MVCDLRRPSSSSVFSNYAGTSNFRENSLEVFFFYPPEFSNDLSKFF